MIAPRPGRIARAILTSAAALAGGFGAGACLADAPASPTALAAALKATAATGRPTVVVVTSAASPSSKALLPAMLRLKMGAELAKAAAFVEADVEDARRAGVSAAPGLAVARRVGGKVESTRYETAPRDAYDAVGWLYSLGLANDAAAKPTSPDPALVKAGHFGHDVQPSAQGAPPQYSAPPPPQYATPAPPPASPPMQQFVGVPSAPVVSTPAMQPVVVSSPSQSIVFQQSAPTVYLAPPSQPANIVLLNAPQSAPSVSMISPVSMVQQPQQQLFLSSPAPAPVAVAQPVQMVAAAPSQPVSAAPVAAQPVAASQVEAIAPGPLSRLIGNFGERLAKHKQPRLRVASPRLTTTTLLTQSSNVALATVPVASAPQQAVMYAPVQAQPVQQVQQRLDPVPQQPVAAPSPQGYGPR